VWLGNNCSWQDQNNCRVCFGPFYCICSLVQIEDHFFGSPWNSRETCLPLFVCLFTQLAKREGLVKLPKGVKLAKSHSIDWRLFCFWVRWKAGKSPIVAHCGFRVRYLSKQSVPSWWTACHIHLSKGTMGSLFFWHDLVVNGYWECNAL